MRIIIPVKLEIELEVPERYIKGKITDVRIVNRCLTKQQLEKMLKLKPKGKC